MIIKEVNIGNGIIRLDVEQTSPFEVKPSKDVMDDIMRDIIKNRNNRCEQENRFYHNREMHGCLCCQTAPNREPDGIDVHVDRPLRENFSSQSRWADAMAKYRTLERVAKACDWECKEEIATVPNYKRIPNRFEDDELLFDDVNYSILFHLM